MADRTSDARMEMMEVQLSGVLIKGEKGERDEFYIKETWMDDGTRADLAKEAVFQPCLQP